MGDTGVTTTGVVVTGGAGPSNLQQPAAAQLLSADEAAMQLQALLMNANPADRAAMLAAAQAHVTRTREQQEREAAALEYQQLMARAGALAQRYNIPSGEPVSTSPRDALIELLLQRHLQQGGRQVDVDGSGEGNAVPGGSKASLAKSMNKPKVWEGSNGGERRAGIFLKEVQEWAELHGAQGQDILQNYLGDKVKSLFIQQVDAWKSEGVEVTWDRMCSAFCTIVGETEDDDKAKALDDLSGLRVRQRKNQTLGEFKVHFQHEMLRAGGGMPNELAVRWFIYGLGCKELRSACQPDLTAGKLKDVDAAFLCAKGQEAKLSAVGIRPFHSAHQAASNTSGAVATLQGKSGQGGNKRGGPSNQGPKRQHSQAFTRASTQSFNKKPRQLPELPPGIFYDHRNLPVNTNNEPVCSRCYSTKEQPVNGCAKAFHPANKLPAPPRI